ncbi:GLIPR1-like protein 1 isoform X1 [Carassius gibelio]|uniref:GLIPR1-like protein 1 isoform X1 n=1 Tax=Carassius gibelio TaxID=101364 RepID=UPI0022787B65|nr:GLIPR1-like protein 1 isoform X1 [Carassius gibelio]
MNVYLLISVTVLLGLCSCEPVFDITDPAFIEECVREHNKHRSNVKPTAANMRYMTWDEGLAVTARAWARFCVFKHNIYLREVKKVHPTFTSVGENIWVGTPYSSFKPESAVKSWKDEDKDYNYDTKQCTNVCGHYTQIVWADSYKVGCAAQVCPNGVAETSFSTKPGIIFVCNYATAGNYRGASPYRRGEPCSGCKQETCANNLCQNSTRDALQSYNWTPDWDPSPSSCASGGCDYQTHILVLLMFACVYGLQHLYNLFEYE